MSDWFRKFSDWAAYWLGSAPVFVAACIATLMWGVVGPAFHFSTTWQLIANTSTTIITFLMVFIIQNTQNRDNKAIHLKLDEIINALKEARNEFIDLEHKPQEKIDKASDEFGK